MVGQILLPNVTLCGEVGRDVLGHLPYETALVIAWEDSRGWARRLVIFRLAMRHTDEKERQRLQQLLPRQDFAVKELHRILAGIRRHVGQPHVVPAEVLLTARISRSHHVTGVGGEVQKRVLKNLLRVVALGELCHSDMHVLIGLMLQLQRHNGQAIEEEHEINLLIGFAEIEMRAERDTILNVFLGGGTCR